MTRDWEIPYAEQHCFGASCELDPQSDEWLLFSPHNLDSGYFETTEETDQSRGGNWDGRLYISHYHAGVWIVDVETLILPDSTDRIDIHFEATVGYYLHLGIWTAHPSRVNSMTLGGCHSFGLLNSTKAESTLPASLRDCIFCNWILIRLTLGLRFNHW